MKQILIACAMMEDEIQKVYKEINCTIPVLWVERGYHNTPEKLREKLQEMIDGLQDYDRILLSFGLCGNGTAGIVSPKAVLVLPRFDDCINMLLCVGKRTTRGLTEAGSIYLTRGWTMDKEAILAQYEAYVEQYGEEAAEGIIEMMYEHYEAISVIDTESYELAPVLDYAKRAAELLDLSTKRVQGSTKMLTCLLTEQWSVDFIVQKPGQPVQAAAWDLTDGN